MSQPSAASTSATSASIATQVAMSQPAQSSTTSIIGAQNQVLALNMAQNLPGVPFAMPVPGIAPVPLAVNPQIALPSAQNGGNMQALAQSLQTTNAGGSIIVLNVGNGNNLAAALTQLGSLIQQPQGQAQVAQVSTAATVAQTVINSAGSPSTPVSSVDTVASTHSTPVATTMNPQPSAPIVPQVVMPQSASHQNAMPIPTQLTQQQQPAAFMLVPIPQIPRQQNVQPSLSYPQPGQTPVFVNLHNQVSSASSQYSSMPPLQSAQIASQQQGAMQQAASTKMQYAAPSTSAMLAPSHPVQSAVPKSDELRAFLMRSTSNNVPVASGSLSTSSSHPSGVMLTPSNVPCKAKEAREQSAIPIQPRHIQHSSPVSHHTLVAPTTPTSTSPQIQPTVSSPGLAFLAQVSSLTSPEQMNSSATTRSYTRMTHSSPILNGCFQDLVGQEVNNNVPVLHLDEVNENAPVSGNCPTSSSSMTVSSTTKIGDESIRAVPVIIREQPVMETAEVIVQEIMEQNNCQFQGNGEKRKKAMPVPAPVKEKKKKGPAPKLSGNEVCLICGDKASGFHYNTLSCEGCKGFFRRTVIKSAKYQCKQNGDCTMDLYMRRKCQKCRFEKCKAVGMREESVLSEEKVKAKKMKKEADITVSPMRGLGDDPSIPKLTSQQRSLLELLKANERRFQWPTIDDMKKVTVWVEGDDTPHSRALRFAHFTELCILIVQLVVEFTKQLPGFLTVPRDDQIVLLKACAIEVMLLRAAKQYNKHDGTINFLNGKLYDKSTFYKAGMQVEFVDPIFQFCSSMAQLDLDETEYAILVAINTFSTDRPHIKDIEKVECMQDPYVELLRVYSKIRHPDDPLMFARILMKIVELRTLNNYHSEQIFALKVQDKKLPPLLAEIWDM